MSDELPEVKEVAELERTASPGAIKNKSRNSSSSYNRYLKEYDEDKI